MREDGFRWSSCSGSTSGKCVATGGKFRWAGPRTSSAAPRATPHHFHAGPLTHAKLSDIARMPLMLLSWTFCCFGRMNVVLTTRLLGVSSITLR